MVPSFPEGPSSQSINWNENCQAGHIREVHKTTEAPEEFEGDTENKLTHLEDDDADGQDNDEEMADSNA